ncbi:tyrosine-type recombinase/integrase [Jatrophihabitans endophyticus]|uniref:tyrosine-type recombinase/integrase n=1 Tax=Jatrophihabitans endophyticus TaxID=1206085 RepID=UPI0019FF4035|nr:tyrosine-type recombinase/integrase [Jatrophihabitans endophyticus]MBE7187287.1 tyrosine-type recombinase/integrase [Jatrophihabitans endophyticus]
MASIAKRSDGRWRARYRDHNGKETSRHFDRKIDAQHWLDSITTAVTNGTYVDPIQSRISVAEWSQKWLSTKTNLKATTRRDYESLLEAHIVPRWGDATLADVRHEDITTWVAELTERGLSASRVRAAHVALSQILKLAIRSGRLARNPAEYVPLPRVRRADKRYLNHDEVDALADACQDHRVTILFLAYTGVRYGEMAALRVERLDLLRRRALISESVAEVAGRLVFSAPKTHQTRSVPIPRFLLEDLAQLVAGKGPRDLVFTGAKGAPLRLSHFRRAVFLPAVARSGLDGLTPHGLRHTAASLAIAAGAPVKVVQTMLGHASATMTLDLYGHLYADQLDEVADRMDAARAARSKNSGGPAENSADFLRTNGQLILMPRSSETATGQ